MKLPNGYGSVEKLSGRRKKPFAVRVTEGWDENGKQIKKYVAYFEKRKDALDFLAEYNKDPAAFKVETLREVFEKWSKTKFKKLSESSISMYNFAWNYLKILENMDMKTIKKYHIQDIIDNNSHLSKSAQKQIKSLASQMFEYAIDNDISDKNYAINVELTGKDTKKKGIFTDEEINILFENTDLPYVDSILVLIYTGMRVGEMLTLTKFHIDEENGIFRHGIKTDAGKDRVLPIHPRIMPFFKNRMKSKSEYIFPFPNEIRKMSVDYYRKHIYYKLLEQLRIQKLSPHQCRHTFSSLLNRSVSNKEYISRLMGHTDYSLTANVYTHTEIEELKEAIKSIK